LEGYKKERDEEIDEVNGRGNGMSFEMIIKTVGKDKSFGAREMELSKDERNPEGKKVDVPERKKEMRQVLPISSTTNLIPKTKEKKLESQSLPCSSDAVVEDMCARTSGLAITTSSQQDLIDGDFDNVATRIVKGNEKVYETILMGEPVDFDILHVMFAEGMKAKVGSKNVVEYLDRMGVCFQRERVRKGVE
jgi:hypothetical protein